jgi:hypothetical protein
LSSGTEKNEEKIISNISLLNRQIDEMINEMQEVIESEKNTIKYKDDEL